MPSPSRRPLAGTRIAITRPAGTGAALARRVRALGGTPLLLPGSSLRAAPDAPAVRKALRDALACAAVVFTSPAAVRFARRVGPLRTRAAVLAPGRGTQRALKRAGLAQAQSPERADSEGLLALPALRKARGQRIGIVGAPGGRGLIDRELTARGARVVHAHVYQRQPARLGHRHADAMRQHARRPLYVLLSSAEALANLTRQLPPPARAALLGGCAVASSERMADLAHTAGFARVVQAPSAHAADLLAAVASAQA